MKKYLIHISFSPLSPMLAQNMCLSEMKNLGYEIIYYDLNGILNQTVNHDPSFSHFIKSVKSWDELHQELSKFEKKTTLVNIQIGPDKNNFSILRKLYSIPFKKSFFEVGTLPESSLRTLGRIFKYKFAKFPMTPDYVFRAGSKSVLPFSSKTKIFPINYCDYDSSLKISDELPNELKEKKYCVFIDQYLPGHPDFLQNDINKESYYISIKKVLKQVEVRFGLVPVIALHPKADGEIFEKAEILTYKHKTIQLIKGSSLVMAHYSTAISFAAIYKKPIFFVINDEMLKGKHGSTFKKQIDNYARFFDSKVTNCDCNSIPEDLLSPNLDMYEKFLLNFLTHRDIRTFTNEDLLEKYYKIIFSEI